MRQRDWVYAMFVLGALLAFAPAAAQETPDVSIRLAGSEPARALDPVEFIVTLSLPMAPPPADGEGDPDAVQPSRPRLALMSLDVRPAGLLATDYQEHAQCVFQQQGLSAGQQLEVPCFLYPTSNRISDKLLPSLGALFAKSLILEAELQTMQNNERHDSNAVSRLTLLPPLVAVFYGGMVGALMLAVFRALAPFRHGLSRNPPRLPRSGTELVRICLSRLVLLGRALLVTGAWLVLGGVSAIMIIILTKASTGDLSPIQVEINDFVGGVLVGLLSFPVVTWLEQRLLASEGPPRSPEEDQP